MRGDIARPTVSGAAGARRGSVLVRALGSGLASFGKKRAVREATGTSGRNAPYALTDFFQQSAFEHQGSLTATAKNGQPGSKKPGDTNKPDDSQQSSGCTHRQTAAAEALIRMLDESGGAVGADEVIDLVRAEIRGLNAPTTNAAVTVPTPTTTHSTSEPHTALLPAPSTGIPRGAQGSKEEEDRAARHGRRASDAAPGCKGARKSISGPAAAHPVRRKSSQVKSQSIGRAAHDPMREAPEARRDFLALAASDRRTRSGSSARSVLV